jgi:phosphatidate cytidylyltransferase
MVMRFVSGLIGIPLMVILVFTGGGFPFVLGIGAISIIGLIEFYNGVRKTGADPQSWVGIASVFLFLLAARSEFSQAGFSLPGVLTIFVIATIIVELIRPKRSPIRNLGSTFLGVIYVGWLFSFLIAINSIKHGPGISILRWHVALGGWLVLYVSFVVWASDTSAYLIGRKWGKHKLAPMLSPGKSWEGFFAGITGSVIMSVLMSRPLDISVSNAVALGVGIGIAGVVGDLAESAMKRDLGLKDFGAILPGHGGVLDRFDGLLFAAPLFYYYVKMFFGL